MKICQSVNANVAGQRNAHDQTGRSYQINRPSGAFAGSMFFSSTPNARSSGFASTKKRQGPAIHQPPNSAAATISGKLASGR